jgi:hypothetical protein
VKYRFAISLCFALLLAQLSAWAQTVTGTVNNGTTGKPAAGIEVTLVDPMQGMAELTTTKTDAAGKFSLSAGQAQGPRLVRATRDGVNYFRMITPGASSVALDVYDSAKTVEGIQGTANVIRVQADKSSLQVVQLFAVNNSSSPPRTLSSKNTLEFVLPEGAQLDGADAQGPNGQPISTIPDELKPKGHYAFTYALKPGETRFQVSYHLPYTGEATLSPAVLRAWNHLVVVLPSSMKWTPKNASAFKPMNDEPGSTVQVVTSVQPGQDLSFRVSGTGAFPADDQAQNNAAASSPGAAGSAGAPPDNRPGGGLGAPIDAPDVLARYRWMILGVLAVVLSGGAYISVTRSQRFGHRQTPLAPETPTLNAAAAIAPERPTLTPQHTNKGRVMDHAAPPTAGSSLLQALKDEMFQLEIERQQGLISQQDYEKQKAALDQTLQVALARRRTA